MRNGPNSVEKVKISGKVLLSTIATMDSLGPLGREVLENHGVTKISENEQYPFEIRNAIHKAVLDKYGEIALLAIGFKNSELLYDLMDKPTIEFAKQRIEGMSSENKEERARALAQVLEFYFDRGDTVIKQFTHGVNVEYGNQFKQLDQFTYQIQTTMALEKFSEPFIRGVQEAQLYQTIRKYFSWERKRNTDLDKSGYGYATWFWTLRFLPDTSVLSPQQLLNDKKSQINSQLMNVVLKDAFQQGKKMERLSRQIAKYIPPQINDALFKGDYNTEIRTKRKKLTIFFSDIKNFTSTSEGLQPEDLTKYLNQYFSEMTTIALNCGATIDKYIGDAMMVFFGDPGTKGEKEDARACIEMALLMQDKMIELQNIWRSQGFSEPFQIRMGINTGYCNVGNFGSEQRLTYTIIGGEVNVAQRLEGNSDPNGILISYETYAHVKDLVDVEERQALQMKGINRDIKSFAVLKRKTKDLGDIRSNDQDEIKLNKDKMSETLLEERVTELEKLVNLILSKIQDGN